MADDLQFAAGDFVVYPAHGVGIVDGLEDITVGAETVSLVCVSFDKDRMRLKVPVAKARSSGLRRLSSKERMQAALTILEGKAKIRRTMWSRRAQEYGQKINSGDPVSIAEVLRDLRRGARDSEQSFSERQIYQSALERLARELAAIEHINENEATERLEAVLLKAA